MSSNSQVSIVDFGSFGNLNSIKKAFEKVEGNVNIISTPKQVKQASRIVIGGVGTYKNAMAFLNERMLSEALFEFGSSGKPILGICLGMQLLAEVGFENGHTKGLGLIKGEVHKLRNCNNIPHIGFNEVYTTKTCHLFSDVVRQSEYYFMHSYELINYQEHTALTVIDKQHECVAAVQNNSVFGVQFHPEKSKDAGLSICKNFLCF